MEKKIMEKIQKKYKKAMVTGGAGFIGSNIIEELLKTNIKVVCIDDYSAGKYENIRNFVGNPKFSAVDCDITKYKDLEKHFKDVDIVFHDAASKKNICLKDPRRDLEVNAKGAFNIYELSKKYKVKKVIHASTGSVYAEFKKFPQDEHYPLNPVSFYGVSKLAGERYAYVFYKNYNMDITILRYFHVFGPKQEFGKYGGVVAIFIKNILDNKNPVIFGDGEQERSFTFVKDVVKANLLIAINNQTKGKVYNCASGLKIKIIDLLNLLLEKFDKKNVLKPVYKGWQEGDIKYFNVDNKKIKELGMVFDCDFEKNIEVTINWMKKNLSRYL